MDRRVLPQAPLIVELLEVFFRHHFSLQLCFHFLSVGGHCFWLMQQQIEPIMKSRSAAQGRKWGKRHVGREYEFAAPAGLQPFLHFQMWSSANVWDWWARPTAAVHTAWSHCTSQCWLAERDDGKQSCNKGKFSSSDLCTCYGDCKDQYVAMSLTAVSTFQLCPKTKVYHFLFSEQVTDREKHGINMVTTTTLSCI